ncbi:MAG: nitroreductase family protein [Bacilli bacterium]|nr:nitroreductase family protein [Bacilli bacterium]
MEFEKVIKDRSATRKFSDRKVEKNILEKILEAGRIAPTAKNLQPFKIYVVESDEGLKKIDKASPCRYGAPTVLLVCGDRKQAYVKNGNPIYVMDASIVTTHMMLEATNFGVDNIWVEMFDDDIIRDEFDIPENLVPVCLLPIGYKTEACPSSPFHEIRKSINELVEYK